MNREGVWETMCKSNVRKAPVFGAIVAMCLGLPVMAADKSQTVELPSPQQLITMSIADRLNLFEAMKNLPANQRAANSKALEAEIQSLTPEQKTAMENHFRAEFNALPPDRQEAVMKTLQELQPPQPQ